MHIKVDYPGYWCDGEVLEGRKAKLHVGKRKGSISPEKGNRPAGEYIDCYLVKDPNTGEEFGIPTNKAVVMKDPPVIDLRGRLHADAGMFAEVVA